MLDRIPERNRRVGELVEARPAARSDELARGHLILRAVDAVHGDQFAAAQITGGESCVPQASRASPPSRNPGDRPTMMSLRSYWSDQNQGTLSCGTGDAGQAMRGGDRLLESVVNRLEPDAPAVMRIWMIGAVSGGINRRIGRATELVHDDAVRALDTGRARRARPLPGRQHRR